MDQLYPPLIAIAIVVAFEIGRYVGKKATMKRVEPQMMLVARVLEKLKEAYERDVLAVNAENKSLKSQLKETQS